MVCGDSSYGLGPGEKTTVNSVDDGLGADLTAAEEAAVQTLDGVFTSLDTVEFEVDVALGIRV